VRRLVVATAVLFLVGLATAVAANFTVNAEDVESYSGIPTSTLPCKFVPGKGGGVDPSTPGANPCRDSGDITATTSTTSAAPLAPLDAGGDPVVIGSETSTTTATTAPPASSTTTSTSTTTTSVP
jgi:hypothetical protein